MSADRNIAENDRDNNPSPTGAGPVARRVVDDLPQDVPITEEELRVLEAFLWNELKAILESDSPSQETRNSGGAKRETSCHSALPAARQRVNSGAVR